MLSRLFVIFIFLSLPIVVSMLSQRMANTVAAPELPQKNIEVKILADKKRPARPQGVESDAGDATAPATYTPRMVGRVPGHEEKPDENPEPTGTNQNN